MYISDFSGEVFHVSSSEGFTYDEALSHCLELKATLASTADLHAAWKQGFDKCRPGWLSDHSVRYPINKPTLQCGGGKAGVHTVYSFPSETSYPDLYSRYDAYCLQGKCNMEVKFMFLQLYLLFFSKTQGMNNYISAPLS